MLEYISPIILPLLDPTAPSLRWRVNHNVYQIVKGGQLLFAVDNFILSRPEGKWIALGNQRHVNDIARGLASDGCQYESISLTDPDFIPHERCWELTYFLISSET